jgi:hypothetical protein
MSFFDQLETSVANIEYLQASEDKGDVKIALEPIERLGALAARVGVRPVALGPLWR